MPLPQLRSRVRSSAFLSVRGPQTGSRSGESAVVWAPFDDRLDPHRRLAGPFRESPRRHQRHMPRPRRIRRLHRASPNPRNRRQPLTARADSIRIQTPHTPLRLVIHPTPIGGHIRGQTLSPLPSLEILADIGMHRRQTRETRRNLDHRLVDQHRHRIQIPSQRHQTEPLRLQRNRPTTRKRIHHRRQPLRPTPHKLRLSRSQHVSVVAALPSHQPLQNLEQTLPLCVLLLRSQRLIPRRIIHQRSPQHRPSRRQRTTSPPQMQSRRMPMPDRLLTSRLSIDHRQRQRHLNQLRPRPLHAHHPTVTPQHIRTHIRRRDAGRPDQHPTSGIPFVEPLLHRR